MASPLVSADSKSFWQQVHWVNKSKSSIPTLSVDGVSSADHISHLFSTKLHGILNLQHACGRDSLLTSLSSSLSAVDLDSFSVSEECVDGAFAHLKCGKSDGSAILSDHLIHALPAIRSFVASLFTAILRHG